MSPKDAWPAQYEKQAQILRQRLGLDPLSEAVLQKTRLEATATVVDLEAIRQRGRAVLERRWAELVAAEDVERVEEAQTDGA